MYKIEPIYNLFATSTAVELYRVTFNDIEVFRGIYIECYNYIKNTDILSYFKPQQIVTSYETHFINPIIAS